jgi:YjjW family glycine radical enzyme activase
MNKTFGKINKILDSSFVDGPGNRAVVFFQGCNFHCLYCHNPYTINECIHCGICVEHCPENALIQVDDKVRWIEEKCIDCDTCIEVCPYFSSPKVKQMTAEEVWQVINPLKSFISGVSVSGGEPALQIPFLLEFFELIKKSSVLTTYMESNGFIEIEEIKPLLPFLDMVQVDLKAFDNDLNLSLTGYPVQPVKESIRFYEETGKLFAVQQVIVSGYTENTKKIANTAKFLAGINPMIRLQLVKFRSHGTTGEAKNWQSPTDESMNNLSSIAKDNGLVNVSVSL